MIKSLYNNVFIGNYEVLPFYIVPPNIKDAMSDVKSNNSIMLHAGIQRG